MSDINFSVSDGIARLELNRPAVFNALSPDLLEELLDHCTALAKDDAVRVVVLEGAGKHFCAGADLPQFIKNMRADPHGTADLGRHATEALAALPQITIAAIKGHCIGGALVLSAVCDMRVAAANSRFSIPELDAGIPLSWGGMPHVIRLTGESLANDLVLTCRPFDAEDALRAGMLSRIFPDESFATEVTALAQNVARKPWIVLRQTKRKLRAIHEGSFDARDDAAEMIAAMDDPEATSVGREYIRRILRK
jgi:enoyl-CoA hydratase/carnithine racemase